MYNYSDALLEGFDLEEKVEKHDELNPKLFNKDETLKAEVKEKVNLIVDEFLSGLKDDEIKIEVQDVLLVGSNVNYNYTSKSDLDIHIIADTKNLHCPENLFPKLYSAYRSLFNKKFDIDFYGIPVELYVETEGTPRISTGIYSVKQDKWLRKPVMTEIPEINEDKLEAELNKWEERYNKLVNKSEDKLDEAFWNKNKGLKDTLEDLLDCEIEINDKDNDKNIVIKLPKHKQTNQVIAYLSSLGFDLSKIDSINKFADGESIITYKDIPELETLKLQEASTLTPFEKVRAFNNGARRENVKACGDEKLLKYYDIAVNNNFQYAKSQFEAELNRRGMGGYIKQNTNVAQPDPNHEQLVLKILNKSNILNLIEQDPDTACSDAVSNLGAPATLLAYILLAVVTKKKDLQEKAVQILVEYFNWKPEDIEDKIKIYAQNVDIVKKVTELANKVNNVTEALTEEIKTKQINDITKFIEDVYELRKQGLATKEGEWSIDNLVFKEIRNKGYIDNLRELKNQLKAKEMSLEENK